MTKNALAQAAIEAAVEAIEANDYKLVLPLEFTPKHVAISAEKPEALPVIGPPQKILKYELPAKPRALRVADPSADSAS